jgi:pilus assembly protein CpaE
LRSASRIDATLIRTALPHHASHLAVLAQGSEMPLPPPDAPEAAILVERLLEHVEMLLCDLGGLPTRLVPAALLRAADEIWLVADQGIASVVSLDACLRELERIGVRDHRLSLVINRHDADCGIGAEQIAKRFNLPLLATLPDRSRALRASANQGLLLHQVTPRDPYVRALAPLLAKLRTGASHNVAAPRWKTLFTRGGGPRWKTP